MSGRERNPEDEYADDEFADYDAEDREPDGPIDLPTEAPESDVIEQWQTAAGDLKP